MTAEARKEIESPPMTGPRVKKRQVRFTGRWGYLGRPRTNRTEQHSTHRCSGSAHARHTATIDRYTMLRILTYPSQYFWLTTSFVYQNRYRKCVIPSILIGSRKTTRIQRICDAPDDRYHLAASLRNRARRALTGPCASSFSESSVAAWMAASRDFLSQLAIAASFSFRYAFFARWTYASLRSM
jgi:hypothetical protein